MASAGNGLPLVQNVVPKEMKTPSAVSIRHAANVATTLLADGATMDLKQAWVYVCLEATLDLTYMNNLYLLTLVHPKDGTLLHVPYVSVMDTLNVEETLVPVITVRISLLGPTVSTARKATGDPQ